MSDNDSLLLVRRVLIIFGAYYKAFSALYQVGALLRLFEVEGFLSTDLCTLVCCGDANLVPRNVFGSAWSHRFDQSL